jgi:hypothetical protein
MESNRRIGLGVIAVQSDFVFENQQFRMQNMQK